MMKKDGPGAVGAPGPGWVVLRVQGGLVTGAAVFRPQRSGTRRKLHSSGVQGVSVASQGSQDPVKAGPLASAASR